jgi:multidrug transporter EmrE-like cation transporter
VSARLLLFICILLGVIGQLALKRGINAVAVHYSAPASLILHSLLHPLVILGFALYGLASILWILVLARLPLSVAYPAISVGYVLVLLFSWFYLHEPITLNRVLAVALISAGFIILGLEIRS